MVLLMYIIKHEFELLLLEYSRWCGTEVCFVSEWGTDITDYMGSNKVFYGN